MTSSFSFLLGNNFLQEFLKIFPLWYFYVKCEFQLSKDLSDTLPKYYTYVCVYFVVWSLSCVWLFCNSMDCSPPGTAARGISQARTLKWVPYTHTHTHTHINVHVHTHTHTYHIHTYIYIYAGLSKLKLSSLWKTVLRNWKLKPLELQKIFTNHKSDKALVYN